MEWFIHKHSNLLKSKKGAISRGLELEVNWDSRLIGIKGVRGVGKTTFLLDHIRTRYGDSRDALYINLNNLYFTKRTLFSFADEFYKRGGKVLVFDQMNKYPTWSSELRKIYDELPNLKIIFSSSSVIRVIEGNDDLKDIAEIYHLQGLSFREYLNHRTDNNFKAYTVEDVINNHEVLVKDILNTIRPLAFFSDYLQYGYYPYYQEDHAIYDETLLKHINLAAEIDVTYANQIELQYLPKLRKLIQLIADEAPFSPNISKLSSEIEVSRATLVNYLNYLKNARIINLIYQNGDSASTKKPSAVYLQNTNLSYAITHESSENRDLRTTFFLNQLLYSNRVSYSKRHDFLVNGRYDFTVGGKKVKLDKENYVAADMIEIGEGRKIPLWLFGFLY